MRKFIIEKIKSKKNKETLILNESNYGPFDEDAPNYIYTVWFRHLITKDKYVRVILGHCEEEAVDRFNEWCPSCYLEKIELGATQHYDMIGPDFEVEMGWAPDYNKYPIIDSKMVEGPDGWRDELTLYKDTESGLYFIMFGDKERVFPDPDNAEWEPEPENIARERFDNWEDDNEDDGDNEEMEESWSLQKANKFLVYNDRDRDAVAEYLINNYPDETAGWEKAELVSALYALHGNIKGIEGLPFSFDMEGEEEGDELDEDYETEDTIKISQSTRKNLNKICAKYCGWKLPQEIKNLWNELTEAGVDPFLISGYPDSIAEDGGKSWNVNFTMHDKDVINSQFIYQVYEGNGDTLKNEYNIYFS